MDKNKEFKLPEKCIKMEQEKMMDIYGGTRRAFQDIKDWLRKLSSGSKKK